MHHISTSQVREDYFKKLIFNLGDTVSHNNQIFEIIQRGSNYVTVLSEQLEISKKWLNDIEEIQSESILGNLKSIPYAINLAYKKSISEGVDRICLANSYIALNNYIKTKDVIYIHESLNLLQEINQVQNHTYLQEEGNMLDEKTLTPNELDKREEIVKAIKKKGEADSKAYAIATALAKRITEESYEDEDFGEWTDADFDHLIDSHLSEDDYLDAYDDDELSIVDDETGEKIEEELMVTEVLSRMERIKARIRFARTKSKRERKLKIALNKKSSQPVLNNRARKLAIKALKSRLVRKPLNTLSVPEKERLEKRISKMGKVISRLAVRVMPKVRNLEKTRLQHNKFTKDE